MKQYKNIVVAVELEPESDLKITERLKVIQKECPETKLWLVHAVEHVSTYGAAYGVTAGIDIDAILKTEAQQLMDQMAGVLNIPDERCIIAEGAAKYVILDEAKKNKADLIIVGSHGRHGVQLLLGSTANAILHAAECDVLAVRVQD